MLWVAAFLALIIWMLGLASDFLGFRIHLFLLFAIFCALIAMLPNRESVDAEADDDAPDEHNAKSMPAGGEEYSSPDADTPALDEAMHPTVPDTGSVSVRSGQ